MTRKKQAYLFKHQYTNKAPMAPFLERRLLTVTEAKRLRDIFGSDSLDGPYSPEDIRIVSGFSHIEVDFDS